MKVWLTILALNAAVAISVSSPGSAHQVVVGKLKIGHPWVRKAAEGAPGTYSCTSKFRMTGMSRIVFSAPPLRAREPVSFINPHSPDDPLICCANTTIQLY